MSEKPRHTLFLDRDGVINVDHGYVATKERCDFLPGIFDLCCEATKAGYLIVIITNQAGIGRGYYSEPDFHEFMDWMGQRFADKGASIDGVYFCPYHPEYGIGDYRREAECRKPRPGMILEAAKDFSIDLPNSLLIGDKKKDVQAGQAAGIGTNLLLDADATRGPGYQVIETLQDAIIFL